MVCFNLFNYTVALTYWKTGFFFSCCFIPIQITYFFVILTNLFLDCRFSRIQLAESQRYSWWSFATLVLELWVLMKGGNVEKSHQCVRVSDLVTDE